MAERKTNSSERSQLRDNTNGIFVNSEWECDNCKMIHLFAQLTCIKCNKQRPITKKTITVPPNTQKTESYKETYRGLIQCNGDCGSELSELLDNIVSGQEVKVDSSKISLRFRYYDDPLRQTLLKLMRRKALFEKSKYKQHYYQLCDKNYYVTDATQVEFVINLFTMLAKDNHTDILQKIAHQTCKEPSWSLLEQISHATLYDLLDKYNSIKNTINMFEIEMKDTDIKDNQILIDALKAKEHKIQALIDKEQQKVKNGANLKPFLDKLSIIKAHNQYKKMQRQNAPLNDLEILSILFYTDLDKICNSMRASHRDQKKNSCKYSNMFYHLCSAVDKMWRVFHRNRDNGHPKFLFHGNTISSLSKDLQTKLHQKTCTSFTTSVYTAASDFANKLKYNPSDKKGMVWVIDNASKALSNGELRGADVSWMSKFGGEQEYLILPTTFSNFRILSDQEKKDYKFHWQNIQIADHNMYITDNTESMDMSLVTSDITDKLDSPMLWLPPDIKEYDDLKAAFDCGLATIAGLLGHFRYLECPQCKIMSRILNYRGAWSDLSIECPSCRSLLFRSDNTDDRNRKIKCSNSKCTVKYITRLDLKKMKKNPEYGYKCSHCDAQQKITHLNELSSNQKRIERTADGLLNNVEELLVLNAKHTDEDEKEAQIDKQKYKPDLMKIISFLHTPENENKSAFDILREFPVIWKWITSIKYVKLILDGYKDGYTDLLSQGVIDTKNDGEINKILKLAFRKGIESAVKPVVDIANKVLSQLKIQNVVDNNESDVEENDESSDDSNESDVDENTTSETGGNKQMVRSNEEVNDVRVRMVHYNCPQCSKRVQFIAGAGEVPCAQCIQKNLFGFSLFNFK